MKMYYTTPQEHRNDIRCFIPQNIEISSSKGSIESLSRKGLKDFQNAQPNINHDIYLNLGSYIILLPRDKI